MKLQILDIDKFITKNGFKEVKNARVGPKGFDPESIWSEQIFGSIGSRDRRIKYGYIQLKTKLLHPTIYSMLKVCSETTSKIIDKKNTYSVSGGVFVEDPHGETGIAFLVRELPNINLSAMSKKEKVNNAAYLEQNKNLILIDKFIVIPAGYRDIDISKKDSMQMMSEVNNIYKDILYINSQLTGDDFLDGMLIEKLQLSLNKLVTWMQAQLKGKKGILRGSMLKKRMDFSSRLVCTTNQNIPMGFIGIPWHTALAIYEPMFTHYCYKKNPGLLEDIKEFMGKDTLDFNDLIQFIQDFTKHPQIVPPKLLTLLEIAANEVVKDQLVMFKRDPITHRNGWSAAHPMITKGQVVQVNAMDIVPLQGDFDGDTLEILPVFSEEAKQEVKEKICPLYSQSKWFDTQNNNRIIFNFSLDMLANIYRATKDA